MFLLEKNYATTNNYGKSYDDLRCYDLRRIGRLRYCDRNC